MSRRSETGKVRRRPRGELALRRRIVALCREMNATGLNQGTSGNISARFRDTMVITPSGVPYGRLRPEHLAVMRLDADEAVWDGPCKPSSEWHFHRAVLQSNDAYNAVVHTHSTFATVLSMSRTTIPACHYMVAAFGGNDVRCARYATFGTKALSSNVLRAMRDRSACLLANHGMVVAEKDLDRAMWAAVELETLARQYYHACLLGKVTLLSPAEIERVRVKFRSYGPSSNELEVADS